MKRATVYIVILGLVCTALGVAVGVAIQKRYTKKHLPQIVKSQLLRRHRQDSPFHRGPGQEGLPFHRGQEYGKGQHYRGRKGPFEQQGTKPMGENLIQRIAQELNLTSEQVEQVQAILEQSKQEVTQARDEFRTQIEQSREKSNAQILELLDPEQEEKFQELTARKARKERRVKEGFGGLE